MSRFTRLSTLVAVSLAALAAAGCSTDQGLNALGRVIAADADREMPHDSLFALHPALLAQQSANLSVSLDPEASFAAASTAEILGTNLNLGDDLCTRLTNELPFAFTFYGVSYTRPYICPNGNVTFNTTNPDKNAVIPFKTMAIAAPLSADWDLDGGPNYVNNVYWQVAGEAPNRRFILTWHNIYLKRSASNPRPRSTFRLVLHETSNMVEFQYPSLIREARVDAMKAGIAGGPNAGQYIIVASGIEAFDLSGMSVCFTPAGTTYTVDMNPCPRAVPPNTPPVADPLGPYAAPEGSPVYFDGTHSYDVDGDALSFAWTFGDGEGSDLGAPAHVYRDEGDYPVNLTVTDPHGLAGEAGTVARITNVAPSVTLAPIAEITSGETASISATFSDPGVDDAPWTWTLDWGARIAVAETDETSDQAAPIQSERRITAAGSHTVTLSVTDEDGGTTTVFGTLVVNRFPLEIAVRPGEEEAVLNTRSNGKVWVAILHTPTVDASTVLVGSVTFGAASVTQKGRGVPKTMLQDADGDGDLDLWLQFDTQDLVRSGALTSQSTSLELRATLADGREAAGSDEVRVVQ